MGSAARAGWGDGRPEPGPGAGGGRCRSHFNLLTTAIGAAVAAVALATLSIPSGGATAGASVRQDAVPGSSGTSCASELPHMGLASSRPDYAMDNMWRSYADSSRGWSWTGGDGGQSVVLPGGRIDWLFDDSYLGRVVGGARYNAPMLHNLMVVQDGKSFSTLYSSRDGQPVELMNYGIARRHFYWSNDGIVAGGSLWVSYSSYYYPSSPTVFGFVRTGTVLVRYSLSTMRMESVSRVPDGAEVIWGVWMMGHGSYVYVYGTRGVKDGFSVSDAMFLARAPRSDMASPWQYWDGSGWSGDAKSAAVLSTSVASQFSLTKVGNVYVLASMHTGYLSNRLMLWFACRPMGPFVRPTRAYITTGQTGVYGTQGIPGVYTYGASLHPELTSGDQLVISYDVNTSDWPILDKNVYIVRPRFIRATITTNAA
jgi:hypothetical protein